MNSSMEKPYVVGVLTLAEQTLSLELLTRAELL